MRNVTGLSLCCLFTTLLTAQTETLRGKVEDVQGTQNQFFLDATNLPLVSTALNLNAWVGQQAILQVVNIGTAQAPVLRVDAAVATTKIMDMGNLRLGETSTFEVIAPAGSGAVMLLDFTANTGFLPLGSIGVWLLSLQPAVIAGGFTNAQNQFQVPFTTPAIPSLVGLEVTTQAVVLGPSGVYLSNPDGRTVEQ